MIELNPGSPISHRATGNSTALVAFDTSGKTLAEWHHRKIRDTRAEKSAAGFFISELRARYRFVCLVFAVNAAALIFLSLYRSNLLLIGLVVLLFVCGFYAIKLTCPVCGKPVLLNRVNSFGIEMYAHTLTIPSNCSKCSTRLI